MRADDLTLQETLQHIYAQQHPLPSPALQQHIENLAIAKERDLERQATRRQIRLGVQSVSFAATIIGGAFLWPIVSLSLCLQKTAFTLEHTRNVRGITLLYDQTKGYSGRSDFDLWEGRYIPDRPIIPIPSPDASVNYAAYLRRLAQYPTLLFGQRTGEFATTVQEVDELGERFRDIAVYDRHQRYRNRIRIAEDAGQIKSLKVETRRGSDWQTAVYGQFIYNSQEKSALPKRVPDTGLMVSLPVSRSAEVAPLPVPWSERFTGGLAQVSMADRTITLRDVSVNLHGEIFVLFSEEGRAGVDTSRNPVRVSVEDGKNTPYTAQRFDAQEYSDSPPRTQPMHIGKSRIQGAWLVPIGEQIPAYRDGKPLTIRFRTEQGASQGSITLQNEGIDQSAWRISYQWEMPPYHRTTPALGLPRDIYEATFQRLNLRRTFYKEQQNWQKVVQITDFWDRCAAQQFAETGTYFDNPAAWEDRAEALRQLGRNSEVRDAVDRANEERRR